MATDQIYIHIFHENQEITAKIRMFLFIFIQKFSNSHLIPIPKYMLKMILLV